MTTLAIATVFVVGRSVVVDLAIGSVAEVGGFRESVHGAADRVGSVEYGTLAADELDAVDGKGVDRVPVLHRTAAEGGIVNADPIDHEEVLATGKAADEGGAMAVRGFLNEDAGGVLECVRKGAAGVVLKVIGVQKAQRIRNILRPEATAGGGDNKGFEEVLGGKRCGDREQGDGEFELVHTRLIPTSLLLLDQGTCRVKNCPMRENLGVDRPDGNHFIDILRDVCLIGLVLFDG